MTSPNERLPDSPVRRLVGIESPSVPTWFVYHNDIDDSFETMPVLQYCIYQVEEWDGRGISVHAEIEPVGHSDTEGIVDDLFHFVGLSLTPEITNRGVMAMIRKMT